MAAFVGGLALRWAVMSSVLSYVDIDEATIGIQARSFFTQPTVFFPAQTYGGSLEVPFVALLDRLGADGPVALKAVPIAFHLAACVVVWRVATRVVPSALGQWAAPVILWCGSSYGVWASTKEHGFYGAAILLSITIVLLGLRLLEAPGVGRAITFGLGTGLAVWATPLLATAVVPMVVWLAVRRPDLWRRIPAVAIGFVTGALPWLIWNARNGWASLDQQAAFGTTAGDRLADGLAKLPRLVGMETPWATDRALLPAAGILAYVLLAAAMIVATWRTRATAPGLLPALALGYLAVYPLGNVTAFVGADLRYLYPLLPVLALTIGATLPAVRLSAVSLGVVVVTTVALSAWGLQGMASPSADRDLFLAAPGLDAVVDRIEDARPRTVISDVAGYQITYATDGAVEGTVFNRPRFPELERAALVEEPSTYVLLAGDDNIRFEQAMRERGIDFRREQHGVWKLYQLDTWFPPWEAGFTLLFGQPVPRPAGA